jgi:hypothetical protein
MSYINRNIQGGRGWEPPWVWFPNLPLSHQIMWILISLGCLAGIIVGIIYLVNPKLIQGFTTQSEPEDKDF